MTMAEDETVLVVDDLPQNIRLLEAILAPRGYRVASASSGREALERLAAEPIDLVLLDILMPEMDGYEVCRALRADTATSFLPVVMITASGEQEKVAAIEAGADDFIAKPFDQAELLARVRSLLRIKQYHDTIEAQAGSSGSCRPSSPSSSSHRGTNRSSRATAARSRWSSATCAASRASRKRSSPRT
jgi:adenylate cyclase